MVWVMGPMHYNAQPSPLDLGLWDWEIWDIIPIHTVIIIIGHWPGWPGAQSSIKLRF